MIKKIYNAADWDLDKFIIGARIGKGTLGNTYLVKQRNTGLILTLKCFSKHKAIKRNATEQIKNQMVIHSHLSHPNIIDFYGYFQDHDHKKLCLMMEYATQGSLFQLLKKYSFNQQSASFFIKQVIHVAQYLHNRNIIHRDIKPQNILVSSKGQIKLCDFSWAVKKKCNCKFKKNKNYYCGTPEYMSPEVLKKQSYNHKVDNWSIGILAYEFVVGKTPFQSESESIEELGYNILYKQPSFPVSLSIQFKDFVSKLLKKDAKERMELKQALDHPWLCDTANTQTDF